MAATRRLAAILAADVAGYSRLMGADEEGTLDRLKAHRRQLVDPKIAEHRGRIVKTAGDGMLVEFPSVVDAVRCAVEVQRGMLDREWQIAEDQRIRFRVGVNLGDIIIDGGDIFGDGVNVAARLEALAEPGGICMSRTVRNQVRDKLPYSFEDMGEQSVKNIARPVRVDAMSAVAVAATPLTAVPAQLGWARRVVALPAIIAASLVAIIGIPVAAWWTWPNANPPASIQAQASPQSPPAAANIKPAPRLSVVVLPFTNLSNDPEQEYFVDSITDDLTTDLSRISDSFVIARTTAFTYKGKPVDAKQIGHQLGVRYVLEGSARRSGERIQVNVQLIDADTGAQLWSDRFDADRTNLAKAQSEITGRLARTLHIELVEAADRQIEQEKNPDARDLVMRGWASYYRPVNEVQVKETQRAFEQALEMDPRSVGARIGIATVLVENVTKKWSKSPEQDLARAEKLLLEASERDRNNSRAQYAMGMLRRLQDRLIESRIAFEKAIALDRNYASAMLQLGYTLTTLGEPEAALPHFEKALQLTPQHQNIFYYYSGLGVCHLLLGHVDEAIDFLRKARAAGPGFIIFRCGLRRHSD
jgi:TolB-like protein/class 3 adenylate cyclase/lipopolysaccharide biosynthesis regulator YciM